VTKVRCIFSDLDGTLCHFDRDTCKHGVTVTDDQGGATALARNSEGEQRTCRLLPTSTMGNGVVSDETVRLVDELRKEGVKFVVVSGARTTTILKRIPLLPRVDACISETGSRVMYAPPNDPGPACDVASRMKLDTQWASKFEHVTGPLDGGLPVAQRQGSLWDLYREMEALGLRVDSNGYTGCFRVDCKKEEEISKISKFTEDREGLAKRELSHAMNLGKYDFFPAVAGKGNTVKYLQELWGLQKEECVCLFDDDNDLPMTEVCGVSMLPGVTSDSVRKRLGTEKDWILARCAGTGVFATEELLQRIVEQVRKPALSEDGCLQF